jgi:hypothetical protein
VSDKTLYAEVQKVDEDLGIVMGWAIICKEDGTDYFDSQGDHITEAAMTKAALDFMENSREAHDMHRGDVQGAVVFAFPLTEDVAKAFGILTHKTGLVIAMRPSSKEILNKFRNGEYTGFSIGGLRGEDEVLND